MRFIGEPDYFDGTAFSSDGKILSMLVYRRTDSSISDQAIRQTLKISPASFRPKIIGSNGARPSIFSRLKAGRDTLCWDGMDLRIQPCEALFCGTLYRGACLTFTTAWSTIRDFSKTVWCWTPKAYEEALAAHGLKPTGNAHYEWLGRLECYHEARQLGIVVATYDQRHQGRTPKIWRTEAATLKQMEFDRVLSPNAALNTLASWLGHYTPHSRVRTLPAKTRQCEVACG